MGGLRGIDARVKLACLLVYIVATLHARTLGSLAVCLAAAMALAVAVRLGIRDVRAVMRPLAPVLVVTAIMQVLYFQQGTVLVQLGPVAVTAEALWVAVRMVLALLAIMLASVAFMRCTSTEELMELLRWLLAPLRSLGVRVEGLMLALSVAFRFVPVLVGDFRQVKRAQEARSGVFDGGVRQRLDAYTRLFAPLVRSSFRRADTLGQAFVARCFSCGIVPTSLHVAHVGWPDALFCVATVLVVVAAFVL